MVSPTARLVLNVLRCASAIALIAVAPALSAGPILSDVWFEFGFTDAGVAATGCDPADPAGAFCIPSSGTPTEFLDAPPWTFAASAAGATLTVTDAFLSGDQFELFDFGASIGLTSPPAAAALVDCGDDPEICLATAGMSSGSFVFAAGPHSITLIPVLSPEGGGAGYLRVTGAAIPEPGSLVLITLGLLGLFSLRLRRTHA